MITAYVMPEEATAYIKQYMPSDSDKRVAWEALSNEDKSVSLLIATLKIDALPLKGRKIDRTQENEFPRTPLTIVPEAIKAATALEACSTTGTENDADKRAQLRAQGVTSVSVGNVAEQYEKNANSANTGLAGFINEHARRLLKPYVAGVVPIV